MKNLFVLVAAMVAVCLFAGESQAFGRRSCGGGRVHYSPCNNTCGFHPLQTVWNGVSRVLPPYSHGCTGNTCTQPSVAQPTVGGTVTPALPKTGPAQLPNKGS